MRIISGKHKGRRFSPPKNLPVRPTTDMAKESLFNILPVISVLNSVPEEHRKSMLLMQIPAA